jgi:hypothetical protein
LVISDNYGLYFPDLKPCIMPGENAHTESDQENGEGDCGAPAPPMIDRFAFV